MIDQESLYRLLYEKRWGDLLDAVYAHHHLLQADPLLARAVETFITTFFEHLADHDPAAFADALEKLFLLHTGGFYPLPEARFDQVIESLVTLHADRPETALGYARLRPENALCAALIRQYAPSKPNPVAHTQAAVLDLTISPLLSDTDATISLFKSQQEIDFFMAVREVYATYFVYPNVALSCLIDYERIRDDLTSEERAYFFRALVDCVVFDQHQNYRPLFFFELDSALHDTDARRVKDRYKEHILALAGQHLHRLRKRHTDAGRAEFVKLLKEITE